MAKESLELTLELHAESRQEQVLPGTCAAHVVVGEIEAEVPDVLLKEVREDKYERSGTSESRGGERGGLKPRLSTLTSNATCDMFSHTLLS